MNLVADTYVLRPIVSTFLSQKIGVKSQGISNSYTDTTKPLLTVGYHSGFNVTTGRYVLNAIMHNGNSGGPVVRNGKVCAVVTKHQYIPKEIETKLALLNESSKMIQFNVTVTNKATNTKTQYETGKLMQDVVKFCLDNATLVRGEAILPEHVNGFLNAAVALYQSQKL